jgi:hypothetical protein
MTMVFSYVYLPYDGHMNMYTLVLTTSTTVEKLVEYKVRLTEVITYLREPVGIVYFMAFL